MMKALIIKPATTFFKTTLLVVAIFLCVVQSQSAYADNPSIALVQQWRADEEHDKFIDWILQFDHDARQTLYISYNYAPIWNWLWGNIENWINANGGPTDGYVANDNDDDNVDNGDDNNGPEGGLDLAKAPLFLSTTVEPNIHFILDDSGSMFWEALISDEVTDLAPSFGRPSVNGFTRMYFSPTFNNKGASHSSVVPPVELGNDNVDPLLRNLNEAAWLVKNAVANPGYYDPTKIYEPWPGLDNDGTPLYEDADPTAAKNFPYDHLLFALETIDLTDDHFFEDSNNVAGTLYLPVFYNWFDSDSDGLIETSDLHDRVEIRAGNEALFLTGRSYEEELQNFANWFQYYRKREFAAKVAIGNVINSSDGTRMGLDLINFGHEKDLKSITTPENKVALLKELYKYFSEGGTPLRDALKSSGEMFSNSTNAGPILQLSEGGSCQQNFQILMTDGSWNGSSPGGIGNADGNNNTDFDGGNYADNFSATLADVAMYYYENDLSSLADEVPTSVDVDEADHQHLVTYTIAFGLNGTLDPEVDDPDLGNVTWPQPTSGSATTIDDLWHAAYNGRGEYLNAAFPDELEASLDTIIANISERTATASAVAINSARLTTDTVIYLAEFNTFRWQGEIYAYPIENINTGELSDNPSWSAGVNLNARDLGLNPRTILTYDGDDLDDQNDGVAFRWDDLNATHKNDLDTTPSGEDSSEAEAQALLNFIRGDRSNEGEGFNFRERSSLLGDVVNSGPVYVGKPSLLWPDVSPFPTGANKYSDFKVSQANRQGVIYVGANDGMLHGFDEVSGEELLAYLPNILFSPGTNTGLHYLSNPNYVHQYYNDLTPSISDVYLNAGSGVKWNSILIGGLRGGGSGIYALDVTNPSSFQEANAADIVMWEFTSDDDNDLGKTYSKPQIAMTNNGKWVAIFGNGYNNLGSGQSALFIVDIEAGVDGTWSAGDYKKISTGSGDSDAINGLSTPALADLDGDGDVDRIYAGDLNGQLWVFDLSSGDPDNWVLDSSDPLFTTIDGRAITAKPALSKHPSVTDSGANAPNVLVYFGSGQYLEDADKTDTTLNHFYGVWDTGDNAFNLTSASLVEQTFLGSFTYDDVNNVETAARVLSQNEVDYEVKHGWYFDLPDTRERSITGAVVRFGTVFFNTFVPTNSPCLGGGYGYKMAVDSETGGALNEAAYDANGDNEVDGDDIANGDNNTTATIAGIRSGGYLPPPVFIEDLSFTGRDPIKVKKGPDIGTGRLSWQELLK